MSFLLPCPQCGMRPQPEFAYGGTIGTADEAALPPRMLDPLSEDLYFSDNLSGQSHERWFHRQGCDRWLVVLRDTRTNRVSGSWPGTEVPR
jgi:heterotetrameric sarcosine oxidase delta subunit